MKDRGSARLSKKVTKTKKNAGKNVASHDKYMDASLKLFMRTGKMR